jgi:hypothetical protein
LRILAHLPSLMRVSPFSLNHFSIVLLLTSISFAAVPMDINDSSSMARFANR